MIRLGIAANEKIVQAGAYLENHDHYHAEDQVLVDHLAGALA